jgi:hypothetical protein
MPYGRTTHEQVSSSCSGYDVGEDNYSDYRSHHQDQVEPSNALTLESQGIAFEKLL